MIVQIPQEVEQGSTRVCVICRVKLPFARATAGLLDANNRQTFACVSHFSEVELLIIGWADFIASERTKYRRQQLEADALYGEVGNNAWLDS